VQFSVLDKINNKPLQFIDIKAYDMSDTTLVNPGNGYTDGMALIFLEIGKKYMLELTACTLVKRSDKFLFEQEEDDSYEKLWVEVDLTGITDDNYKGKVELPPAYFEKKGSRPIELKEVSVTASRIIFYHKGDTLIYRADAFVLPEGSMLDALFEQLPGVELRGNGEIYCRGRRVDNLLLNGKDLFNGKKELMLENLGAYTVKDIATYEKSGYASELMERKIKDDVQYVMDVRLKKEYHTGFMMNMEGGYGTHNRYIGKLFGMWYGDFASVSTYANLNNLSDSNKPGREDGAWSNSQTGNGVISRKNAGITYSAGNRKNTWELKGDVDFAHTDNDLQETISNQTFMSPADMFNYRWQTRRQKNIHVSTSHKFRTKQIPRTSLFVNPKFEYNKSDDHLSQLSASFNRDMSEEISREFVSNIYEGNTSEILKSLINRSMLDELTKGHYTSGGLNVRADTKLKENWMMSLLVDGDYRQTHSDRFRKHDVRYGVDDTKSPTRDYQYFKLYPDRTFNVTPQIWLDRYLPDFYRSDIMLMYKYTHHDKESTSDLYRLDRLESAPEFGLLPSMLQYRHTFDPGSSYSTHTKDDSHKINVKFQNSSTIRSSRNYSFLLGLDAGIILTDRSYNYILGDEPSNILRRNVLFDYNVNFNFNYSSSYELFYISLSGTPTKAHMGHRTKRSTG